MHTPAGLVRAGLISPDDLVAALSLQDELRPPLGQVAMEMGMLTPRQVREALSLQDQKPELQFGEAAVELGFLTRGRLAELILQQQEQQRPLLDVLVDLGRLTDEQARAAQRLGVRRGLLTLPLPDVGSPEPDRLVCSIAN
ncbi:hypothetical protein [Botrimarina sp.]|uniref:hypothetical protein n=1 Tax=Botrimarina sp. TaxID=2795802 RepID=UPI0032EB068C